MSTPKAVVTKTVRLLGGPCAGANVTIPRSDEHYYVGTKRAKMWHYAFGGNVDGHEVFAIVPRKRTHRRFIARIIHTQGKHPRVLMPTQSPYVRPWGRNDKLALRRMERNERLAGLRSIPA